MQPATQATDDRAASEVVPVAKVGAPFGVRGWVKIRTDLEDSSLLLASAHWQVREPRAGKGAKRSAVPWESREVLGAKRHADAIVAQFAGSQDRDAAVALRHFEIGLPREQLGSAGPGEYFWVDLIGLPVVTVDGVSLGKVTQMMETGANDVLVVRGKGPDAEDGKATQTERLIPFLIDDVVREVTLRSTVGPRALGTPGQPGITVDWDPDF